jgi:WD40 repeat protein
MSKEEKNTDPTLIPKAVFGIRSDISNNIVFFSNDKCAYLAGNYIVICTLKEKNQIFIPLQADWGEISSFSIDEYKEGTLLAFAQKTIEVKSSLCIIRYTNKSPLNYMSPENAKIAKFPNFKTDPTEKIIAITTSALKGLVLLLLGPHCPSRVAVFQYDLKSSSMKFSFEFDMVNYVNYKQLQFNPYDNSYISFYGDGGFGICVIKEWEKKTITQKIEVEPRSNGFSDFLPFPFNFVGMTWVSPLRIALTNTSSDIFILDFTKKFETPMKKFLKGHNLWEEEVNIKAIYSKSKNIYLCRNDGQLLKIEDRSSNDKIINYEKIYISSKTWTNIPKMEVHTLSVNSSIHSQMNHFVISTMNNQIYLVDISNELGLNDGNNFRHLICPFHSDDIVSIDVCRLKSLLVTASRDRSIRVWNFINLQNEIKLETDDYPISVAFHPNGLHIAALFKETCKLMHVLEKTLVAYKTFTVFHPLSVKFSNYGHMFNILSEKNFQIYNFYSGEVILSSLSTTVAQNYWDELTSLKWDKDDAGFATCGKDGRVYYWRVFNPEDVKILTNKGSKFYSVDIHNLEDGNKKIILSEENCLRMTELNQVRENDSNIEEFEKIDIKSNISHLKHMEYDQESKILIISTTKEFTYNLHVIYNPFDSNRISSFQANTLGVESFKTTQDMNHLFCGGKDRCLFFFSFLNVVKNDNREDAVDTVDLILVKKEELDLESKELIEKLAKADMEIKKEIDKFEEEAQKLGKEIEEEKANMVSEIDKYLKDKNSLEQKFLSEIEFYNAELNYMYENQREKIDEIKSDWNKNINVKINDKKREDDNKNIEISKMQFNLNNIKKQHDEIILNLKSNYSKTLVELNAIIKKLEEEDNHTSLVIEHEKNEKMELNDTQIIIRRSELDTLKKVYEKVKSDHSRAEEKLKSDIKSIRDNIRNAETKLKSNKDDCIKIKENNELLVKQINDCLNDKREKEETINEKNNLKNELEKENQELEKFKFVLNYKIKELKHDKDPEERRLNILEKQAKDMEGEIKKFEFEQARNIIDLNKSHDKMRVKQQHIIETEKSIEKLKNYQKLFQEELYHAIKHSKNHKDFKKELVKLKSLFLDKEFISFIEKPLASNYDSLRHFYEDNITNYRTKISNTQKIFTQDYQKIMRENKKLLTIVNELKKEIKEIKKDPNDVSMNKTAAILRPKASLKPIMPIFSNDKDSSNEQKILRYKKELFEIEKDIQLIKEKKKKLKYRMERDKSKTKKLDQMVK